MLSSSLKASNAAAAGSAIALRACETQLLPLKLREEDVQECARSTAIACSCWSNCAPPQPDMWLMVRLWRMLGPSQLQHHDAPLRLLHAATYLICRIVISEWT